jgi:deoxyribonuclease V
VLVGMMTVEEAERAQAELRQRVELVDSLSGRPGTATGVDVSYEVGSDRIVAAAATIELETLTVVEVATTSGLAEFPYVPGLLGFRETPILMQTLGKLTQQPQVLVCDGYGIAHPRRFGLACHLGVLTGLPSFGVAKTPFTASFTEPGLNRGDWSALTGDGEELGRVLRTQHGIKPVFVSVGHRIGIERAVEMTLRLSPKYRLPETTRKADSLSRQVLAKI